MTVNNSPELSPLRPYREGKEDGVDPLRLVRQFQDVLAPARPSDVIQLPDFAPLVRHDAKFLSADTINLEAGLYLAPAILPSLGHKGGQEPAGYGFTNQSMLKIGKDNSRRKVFFGMMQGLDEKGETIDGIRVAVKPFEKKDRLTMFHECAMYHYLGELAIPTLTVVGTFLPDLEKGDAYTISRFNPSVETMDNVAWHELDDKRIREHLRFATNSLAELHKRLLFHGDYEFKNIAYGEALGDEIVVDPELMTSAKNFAKPSEEDETRLVLKVSAEFTTLEKSINQFIFSTLGDNRPKGKIAELDWQIERVYEPYFMALMRGDSEHKFLLMRLYNRVIERKKRIAHEESLSVT